MLPQSLLLRLPHCETLNHLKSAHGHATVTGAAALHPSPVLTKLLFTLTHHTHSLTLSPSPSPSAFRYALSLFRRITSPSTFPHNLLIRSAALLLPSPLPSLRLFSLMRRSSVPPDSHTLPFALSAAARLPSPLSLPLAAALHSLSLKHGFAPLDPYLLNSLLHIYASSPSSLPAARRLFLDSPSPDSVTYNTLIDGLSKAGDLVAARKLFDEMPARDTVSFGTLLAGYSRAGRHRDALSLFDRMLADGGPDPDDVAIVSALSCCANLGALDRGKAVHEYIMRNRTKTNVYLSTGLVDMYAKCGCIGIAIEVFESRSCVRNLFTWNAIIVGLAMHGDGELSIEYFDRMVRGGIRPDGVSFLGVLVACSHAGLVGTARRLFDEMACVYGVERELKHYGCMADLLGRAGMIEEAMEMIKGMPMEGDTYVWGGVLGGCRIHGNVEVAEVASRRLLELNPEDSGIYSIMAEIYANARRWEDVAMIRRLMEERNVRKNVGRSAIQLDGATIVLNEGVGLEVGTIG